MAMLVRVSYECLAIRGLVCQCGGALMVKDWHDDASHGWRYEIFCAVCRHCDPNGYGQQSRLVAAAREYFAAKEA